MTGTGVATTSTFTGADVDGLDHLSQEFGGAAEIVDMVKTACEVIVAAASIFGPFGAAFVAYLKGTVIPWLTKVSAALKAMSKVLSIHSNAQKDASSSTTSLPSSSLPSYTGTPNLPTTSTANAPQLPPAATPTSPATAVTPTTPATTVATSPTIGGTTPGTTAPASGTAETPFVQAVTALTGLVKAVDHLIHPGSGDAGTTTPSTPTDGTTPPSTPTDGTTPPTTPPTDGTTPPSTPPTDGTTPPTTPPTDGTTPATPTTPAVPSTPPSLGAGGIDLSTLQPLHPGDTVGVLSIPVDVAPDGTVTPLSHTPLPGVSDAPSHAPSDSATPTHPGSAGSAIPAGGSGAGSTGSGGGAPVITSAAPPAATPITPTTDAVTTAAHAAGPQAEPELRTERIGSHDGLFTGLGQATGIGAGAAALARAVLSEARQNGDGSVLGAVPLPFEADADSAARTEIYQGAIG